MREAGVKWKTPGGDDQERKHKMLGEPNLWARSVSTSIGLPYFLGLCACLLFFSFIRKFAFIIF
jgi:hypothetical protein